MPDQRVNVPLAEAADQIQNGDLLLFRRWGLISKYGRGEYSHAGMAGWWPVEGSGFRVQDSARDTRHQTPDTAGTLMCLEMREWFGGRAVTLASQVTTNPGRIDVYSTLATPKERAAALEAMKLKCGKKYSYWAVLRAAALHVPLMRMLIAVDTHDGNGGEHWGPEHCSGAYANAWRISTGIDVVHNLADRLTEPNDLGRSAFFRYRFTLV